jgi:hypothetical protein
MTTEAISPAQCAGRNITPQNQAVTIAISGTEGNHALLLQPATGAYRYGFFATPTRAGLSSRSLSM